MSSGRYALALSLVAVAAVAACVGDAAITTPLDASSGVDANADASSGADATSSDASVDGAPLQEAGVCSNPKVGNKIVATGNSPINQNSGPFVAGDYVLTSAVAFCNGACSFPNAANLAGGLKVISTGGNGIAIERHLELDQGGPKFTLIDRYDGTFSQAGSNVTVKPSCGLDAGTSTSDGGPETWAFIFAAGLDGGPTGTLRVQVPGLVCTTNQGPSANLTFFFTKQ